MKAAIKKTVSIKCVLCLLTAVLALLAFAACGARDDADAVVVNTPTPVPTFTPPPTPTPTPTPAPTPGPEEYCFARCLTRMRIVKNGFYNCLDSALAEDSAFSESLFWMLGFVYGDKLFDTFAQAGADAAAFTSALNAAGYINSQLEEGEGGVTVTATSDGRPVEIIVSYDAPTDSGLISVTVDGVLRNYADWVRTSDGYGLQYIEGVDDLDGSGNAIVEYRGYRAYMLDNGDGMLSYGTYASGSVTPCYALPDTVSTLWIHMSLYTYNTYKLSDGTITIRIGGKISSRVVGSVSATDEPVDDEPIEGD